MLPAAPNDIVKLFPIVENDLKNKIDIESFAPVTGVREIEST